VDSIVLLLERKSDSGVEEELACSCLSYLVPASPRVASVLRASAAAAAACVETAWPGRGRRRTKRGQGLRCVDFLSMLCV
jgi:hypothetical protein